MTEITNQIPDIPVKKTEQDKIVRQAYRQSLKYLCTKLGMKDWAPFHSEIQRHLEAGRKYNLIMVPRDHLKSSIVTVGWSIQQALANPEIRILIANAVWDNSRKFLGVIERYLAPGSVLESWFGRFQSDYWNQDECTIRQRTKNLAAPTWTTTGIERFQTSQHYDVIICDDLVGPGNIETPEQRRKVIEYFSSLHDLLEKPDGRIVVVGTPWSQDDLYAHIQTLPDWHVYKKAVFTDATQTEVIFPQKFSLEICKDLRAQKGPFTWASQYLLNPVAEEAAVFRREWIKFYKSEELPPLAKYMTVDPAISQSREADFTALMVCGMDENGRIHVLDRVRSKMRPAETVESVFKLVEKWGLYRMGIEKYGFQLALKYDIQAEQRRRGKYFQVDEMSKPKDISRKETFIERLQPYFEQGLIYLREDMMDLVDELIAFPRGRHDDLLDCLAYSLDYLVPGTAYVPKKEPDPMSLSECLKRLDSRMTGEPYERFLADLKY